MTVCLSGVALFFCFYDLERVVGAAAFDDVLQDEVSIVVLKVYAPAGHLVDIGKS